MPQIKNIKVIINGKTFHLRRLPILPNMLVAWELLSGDKQIRIGIIRQYYDEYLTNRVGYQQFRVKYWLATRFYKPAIRVAITRKGAVESITTDYVELH